MLESEPEKNIVVGSPSPPSIVPRPLRRNYRESIDVREETTEGHFFPELCFNEEKSLNVPPSKYLSQQPHLQFNLQLQFSHTILLLIRFIYTPFFWTTSFLRRSYHTKNNLWFLIVVKRLGFCTSNSGFVKISGCYLKSLKNFCNSI